MAKCQVLLIHSPNMPLTPVKKLLEQRGFSIHVSCGWEEAERTRALVPAEQIKYVFIDLTLSDERHREQFPRRVQQASPDALIIGFHPRSLQSLYDLLHRAPPRADVNTFFAHKPAYEMVG